MKTTEDPHYEGFFMYGDQKPHFWSGPGTSARSDPGDGGVRPPQEAGGDDDAVVEVVNLLQSTRVRP